jgi:catechol-2,3-dioxygenase
MGSEYIDIKEYISSNEKEKGSPAMKTGHIHLKVGNIITRLV